GRGPRAKEREHKDGRPHPETADRMCGAGLPYSPERPRIRPHADHGTGLARRRNPRFRRPQTYPRKTTVTPVDPRLVPGVIHRPNRPLTLPRLTAWAPPAPRFSGERARGGTLRTLAPLAGRGCRA